MSGYRMLEDKDVEKLYKRIKPLVRFARTLRGYVRHSEGDLYYIKEVNPHNIAFTWDPKAAKKATGLVPLEQIVTYHTWAYYGFFKPTIAEVLSQIPENCLESIVAFETDVDSVQLCGDYHVASTTLYRKG
jgi:hypothetical protein